MQFEMQLIAPDILEPYLIRLDNAILEAVQGATSIDFDLPENIIAKHRLRLPRRLNGGAVRSQLQVHPAAWLGCASTVFTRMRDHRRKDGEIEPGFMPHLRNVGETVEGQEAKRHEHLLKSGCYAGRVFHNCWMTLQAEAGNPEDGFFSTPPESLGFHDNQIVDKMQKRITLERENRAEGQLQRLVRRLRRDHPQRVAFRQMDKFGRTLICSLPTRNCILANRDFQEAMCMYYGLPNPEYAQHVGKPILQTGRIFDSLGLRICCAIMTGDGWRRGHNSRERQLERLFRASGIDVRTEVDNLFLAYIDDKEGWEHLNGGKRRALIPDFLRIQIQQLGDLKVLHWGPTYFASDVCGGTTESRGRRVHKDYFKKAQWIDVKFNSWTGAKFGGPVCRALAGYGPIKGFVFSQHRVSSAVKDAVDDCANSASAAWARDGARSRKEAKAAYKQGLTKAIGINNYRQFSRLKFDRIAIMLGEGKGNGARNRADAAYECEVDMEYYLRHGPRGTNAAGRAARRASRN